MKNASIGLILAIFFIFQNCKSLEFFTSKEEKPNLALSNSYASPSMRDFNPRFFDESSVYRSFINLRVTEKDSRIDKTHISIIRYNPEFRINLEKHFPNGGFPSFKIEMITQTGKLEEKPGPTGFKVLYSVERVKVGTGSSLDSAWNEFNRAPFSRANIERRETWETIKNGLWLSGESESFGIGSLEWKHRLGSLDFFHPTTEFKSNNNLSASLYYDYNLNRYEKLSIEKKPDLSNLVFEGENASIYFLSGQLSLRYKQ